MPTIAGGQKRLLFTGNVKTNLVNKYTSGAGVGAISTSSRRALKCRATSSAGTLDSKGNLIPGKQCCSIELERKPKAIDHLMLGVSFDIFFLQHDCSGTPPNGRCWENNACPGSSYPSCQ
jgi:hypothetical protein